MPTQYDMSEGDELYRAILEYDLQPTRQEPNPFYDPNYYHGGTSKVSRDKQPWREFIQVPDGPKVPKERMIGPYKDTKPIKAYVTRNRGRYNGDNLRIKRVERVTAWEEVENY